MFKAKTDSQEVVVCVDSNEKNAKQKEINISSFSIKDTFLSNKQLHSFIKL